MKYRRHRICAVIASGLACCLVAGCGGSGEGSAESDTLEVWHYYTAPGQIEALEQQNQVFEDENPGISVEVTQVPLEQLPSRLLSTATTQEGPDVVLDNVVVDFPTLAGSGVLAEMSEYWSSYDDSEQFPDSATWEYEGELYNVMSYANVLGLYYNQDILEELGIEPPETMDELDAALAEVQADGQYNGIAQAGAPTVEGAWMTMPQLLGQGVDYCTLEADAIEEVFTRLADWVERGVAPRETATWNQTDAWQAFAGGDFAFGINGNWNLGDAESTSFEVGTVRFPAGPEGSRVFPGGEGIGIGAFAEDPDLAWQYIEAAWLSPEASRTNFEASGQIPTREDLAEDPVIQENELVTPFVGAASEAAAWPNNPETAAMQTEFGEAASAVLSGQSAPADATTTAVEAIEAARQEGGGDC